MTRATRHKEDMMYRQALAKDVRVDDAVRLTPREPFRKVVDISKGTLPFDLYISLSCGPKYVVGVYAENNTRVYIKESE